MDSSARGIFIVLSIFGLLQIGTCFQCYSCVGAPFEVPNIPDMPPGAKVSVDCADPINTSKLQSSIVDCSDGVSACSKIDMKVADTKIVMRGCIPPQACSILNNCKTCTTNLCNSGSSILPSVLIFSIVSLIVTKLNL